MKRVFFAAGVVMFLVLLIGCERPIKEERVRGIVVSINGHYYKNTNKPLDCRVVTEVEGFILMTTYIVEYYHGAYCSGSYDECWKALLLKAGDLVYVTKSVWADGSITYYLDP